MKSLKRFLSLTLVCLLLCGLLPSFALADDSAAGTIALTDATGKHGDTVTVELQITSNPGIVALQVKSLTFDSTVLNLTEVKIASESGWSGEAAKENGRIVLDRTELKDSTYTGTVATYTFTILETAEVGETEINLELEACNFEEHYVTFNVTPAKVTVNSVAPALKAYGCSLSLEGDIALNFYLVIPEETFEDAGAYVTLNGEKLLIKGAKSVVQSGITLYEFKYRMHAKQMNDDVVLHAFSGEDQPLTLLRYVSGRDITDTGYVYTVQRYIQLVVNNSGSDAKLVNLVKAMSDYGNKAQILFNYDVEHLAALYNSEGINAVTASDMAEYKRVTIKTDRTGIAYTAANLALESDTTARVFFTVNEGTIDDYSFTVNGAPATPFLTSTGYAVETRGIAAKDLDLMNVVEVSDSEGVCLTVKYSALSYAYLALTYTPDDTKNVEACKALYLYNQAANVYFEQ